MLGEFNLVPGQKPFVCACPCGSVAKNRFLPYDSWRDKNHEFSLIIIILVMLKKPS